MLDSLPADWSTELLADLSYRPISYGVLKPGDFDPDGVPMLRIQDVKTDFDADLLWKISPKLSGEYKRTIVRENDIVFSVVGTLGELKLIDKPLAGSNVSRAFAVIGPNEKVLPIYLLNFLRSASVRRWIEDTGRGGAQKVVNMGELRKLLVPLPPLPEQERIAEVLTSVDDSIRATEAVIAQAERVKRGLMEDLLTGGLGSEAIARGEVPDGWQLAQLSQITTKIGSGVTPKGGKDAYVEEGIPLVRSQNVGWGKMLLDDVAFITPEQHEKMAPTKLLHGDVLLNITGASIGRSAVYRGDDLGANVNQHVCIIRPTEVIDAVFLNAFLISHRGQNQIDEFQAGGNRQGLNFKQIGSFRIPVPPMDEQRTTAKTLESVDDQIEANRQAVDQLQRLKRGLMDDLLTGRVRTV